MTASHEVSDCERVDIAVLVVDNDSTTLSVNAGFLRSWEYKVATATSGHEALETLREFRGFFDLVITDLNMQGMNGFELQKRVKSEFHLPVINRRKSVMSKSLEQGAAFCLVKPVRREDLRDVWQYAVAGRREKLRVENGRIVSIRDGEEGEGDSASSPGGINNKASTQNSTSPNKKQRKKYCKRNRSEVVEHEGLVFSGPKRSRICWTVELHSRFLLALRHLGMDKAVPTKILEIMNVPGLTRENVASHLQKYRLFLKRIAEKGILEGLPERALRSRFAMGLPADLIRDIQKRVRHFHLHETYSHQPYSSTLVPRPQSPQTRLVSPPNHYGGTNHTTYGNFHQPYYHHLHRHLVNGGGFMTSANALTASNGWMSNYPNPSLVGNNRSFNYGQTNYYGTSVLQRCPGTYNNHHRKQMNYNNYKNNNRGMILPYYGSYGLPPSPGTYYNNHYGTQLNNNNNTSLTGDALSRVQNVGYTGHNSNGSATANNAIVPVSAYSVEPNRPNISAGLPSLPQQSINGIRNAVTSVNQREVGQMDDFNELFLMLDDMVSIDKTAESPRAGERSTSDILSSFNIEDYIELLEADGDHVSAQTYERSVNVLPDNSSSCTNENPNNLVGRNDGSANLELLDMFVAQQEANSSSAGNSTPPEQGVDSISMQDWDMDLIETLFDAADLSQK